MSVIYTLCDEPGCWHFVAENDAPTGEGFAPFVHLDSGEKEHDHDARPSAVAHCLSMWRELYPELFIAHADGLTGPNSALFVEPFPKH